MLNRTVNATYRTEEITLSVCVCVCVKRVCVCAPVSSSRFSYSVFAVTCFRSLKTLSIGPLTKTKAALCGLDHPTTNSGEVMVMKTKN